MRMVYNPVTHKYDTTIFDTFSFWEKSVLQKHWGMFEDNRYNAENISKATRKTDGTLEVMYDDDTWFHYNKEGEWW